MAGGTTFVRAANGHVEFTITDGQPAFQVGDAISFSLQRGGDSTSRRRYHINYCGKPVAPGVWNIPENQSHPNGPDKEKETEAIAVLSSLALNKFACHIDVHSWGRTVGWVPSADRTNANLRPNAGFSDSKVFMILGAKTASLITDPDTQAPYTPEATPYQTTGDTLVWQYENTGKTALAFLIEAAGEHQPAVPKPHADNVLPGILFLMFSAVDKSFSSKPRAEFRKP